MSEKRVEILTPIHDIILGIHGRGRPTYEDTSKLIYTILEHGLMIKYTGEFKEEMVMHFSEPLSVTISVRENIVNVSVHDSTGLVVTISFKVEDNKVHVNNVEISQAWVISTFIMKQIMALENYIPSILLVPITGEEEGEKKPYKKHGIYQ